MSTAETIQKKVSILPLEKQEDVLRYVEAISAPRRQAEGSADAYEWLKVAASMNLQGPPDWSEKFEEYLEGGGVEPGR